MSYLRLPGDKGQGDGVSDCRWHTSEPQFDSVVVRSSALSLELLCLDIDDSTGTSAKPNCAFDVRRKNRKCQEMVW